MRSSPKRSPASSSSVASSVTMQPDWDYDPDAVAAALPESVQSLLASRVDRLAPADRNLLQAAAVIGRRFEPDLVSVVCGASGSSERSFAAMEALDLIQRAEGSDDYLFKHALVRDALYSRLLTEPRSALHLKVAEELERRAGNRLTEIAETLAYHYAATTRAEKAFAYLSMAGDKSSMSTQFPRRKNISDRHLPSSKLRKRVRISRP